MKYKVEIHKGVNNLKFGTEKSAVRHHLGNFEEVNGRDMFSNCFAEYQNNKLISIEIFGEFVVNVDDTVFSSRDEFEEMQRKMMSLDPDADIDASGATSQKYSLGTYFENGFEAFLIGKEGYYK